MIQMKNMHILLLLLTALLSLSCVAQERSEDVLVGQHTWRVPRLNIENGYLLYADSVSLPGMKREQLYDKAYNWLLLNLKSDDIAIGVHDRKSGRIAGKGKIMYNQSVVANNAAQGIYFDYNIEVDNGVYTYRLDNIKGVFAGKALDYTDMYKEELNKGDQIGTWTHKFRYEMISDMNSFITLFLQGLKAAVAR